MRTPAPRFAWGLLTILGLTLQSLVGLPGVPIMLPLGLAVHAALLLDLACSFEFDLTKGLGSSPSS